MLFLSSILPKNVVFTKKTNIGLPSLSKSGFDINNLAPIQSQWKLQVTLTASVVGIVGASYYVKAVNDPVEN